MRRVALDLGNRKISYCEVSEGRVIQRLTVSSVATLETELGPKQAPAVVAIEACREAWHVHDVLAPRCISTHSVGAGTERARLA